jgi:hypothetical protein
MSNFLKNLKKSVDTGEIKRDIVDGINHINDINKLVVDKYGIEKIGDKMSKNDVDNLKSNVDKIIGDKKNGSDNDILDYLEALENNLIVKKENVLIDSMNKSISDISEKYYNVVTGQLLDSFGIQEKEIDDIVFDDITLIDVSEILNTICLLEVEYCEYLEDSVFYNQEIIKIKKDLIKILKK